MNDPGIYFYNARFYSDKLGRFLSADTVLLGAGNSQAYDRYAYTNNNPIKYIDPTGHYGYDVAGPGEKKPDEIRPSQIQNSSPVTSEENSNPVIHYSISGTIGNEVNCLNMPDYNGSFPSSPGEMAANSGNKATALDAAFGLSSSFVITNPNRKSNAWFDFDVTYMDHDWVKIDNFSVLHVFQGGVYDFDKITISAYNEDITVTGPVEAQTIITASGGFWYKINRGIILKGPSTVRLQMWSDEERQPAWLGSTVPVHPED